MLKLICSSCLQELSFPTPRQWCDLKELERLSQLLSSIHSSIVTSLHATQANPFGAIDFSQSCEMVRRLVSVPYSCERVNATTFVIVHVDKFGEYPFIYAKLHPRAHVLVLVDTGNGPYAPLDPDASFKDLRDFVEQYPVPANGGRPLNPDIDGDGNKCARREYLIFTTHIHYDHIGGLESFAKLPTTKVVSSGFDKSFIDTPEARRKNSLCEMVGMTLPKYEIAKFAGDGEALRWPLDASSKDGVALGLRTFHTPGHTPDSLTIYDEDEGELYTGDTIYYRKCILPDGTPFRQPIEFDVASSKEAFHQTLEKLTALVHDEESAAEKKDKPRTLRICAAHTTAAAPAAKMLREVTTFFERFETGKVLLWYVKWVRGSFWGYWQDFGDPDFSVLSPLKLWCGKDGEVLGHGDMSGINLPKRFLQSN